MSKYIDAEWLKELFEPYESYNGKELAVPVGAILANIDDAPTIDIIHCRECKHWDKDNNCGYCSEWKRYISNPNYYCGSGKLREE